jgi:hypothetical protein
MMKLFWNRDFTLSGVVLMITQPYSRHTVVHLSLRKSFQCRWSYQRMREASDKATLSASHQAGPSSERIFSEAANRLHRCPVHCEVVKASSNVSAPLHPSITSASRSCPAPLSSRSGMLLRRLGSQLKGSNGKWYFGWGVSQHAEYILNAM